MEIDALAVLVANTIVAAAVTDAFEGLRARVARIFGRGEPDAGVQRRLDATRQQLAAAGPEDLAHAEAVQVRQWETRLGDLLSDHPGAAEELRALLADSGATPGEAGAKVTNTISGTIHGSVIMGRDFGDITVGRPDDHPRGERP